jgi:hypothetical protein
MAEINKPLSELDKKKLKLEQELDEIKKDLESTIDSVSTKVSKSLEPIELVKKHPLKALGGSILLGFLFSYRNSTFRNSSSTNSIFSGVKRELTSRLLGIALEQIERSIKKEDS